MPPFFDLIWQQSALVIALCIILYTGHKGVWYWSPGVRALAMELARDRDDWRALAVTLMRKQGIELPDGFEKAPGLILPGQNDRNNNKR